MGLTIHYRLKLENTLRLARETVSLLHAKAKTLPFQEVGPIVELKGDGADHSKMGQDDPNSWMAIQATEYVEVGNSHYHAAPTHLIAFETLPGEGCEPANFGLCRYPRTIQTSDGPIPTGLTGWRWRSFCKTQYASNRACGGVENFLRCHLSIVKLLDYAKTMGILSDVSDEGGYWENRDAEALARQVGEWNNMVAAIVGRLDDALGDKAESVAPIKAFSDFEHMEARGQNAHETD